MKKIHDMTQAELAAFVQTHLRKRGINVILSGGAAVAIYTVNEYVSKDIDLVEQYHADWNKVKSAMEEIGFHAKTRHFTHPETKQIVEFPAGPLSVGEESVGEIVELKLDTGTLRLISPTDCIKDRLAAYYFFNDQQALYQAVMVAKHKKVDMDEIKRWSKASGNSQGFRSFLEKVGNPNK